MRITIALGGNALLQAGQEGSFDQQIENANRALSQLVELTEKHSILLTHGNGPQVGKLHLQNDLAREKTPAMPFDVCGAMTQGQIGYLLQQQLKNELTRRGLARDVITVLTQTEVDPADPAFSKPTKPVGSFYTSEEAQRYMVERGEVWIEDSGRGWRKVVPSPQPRKIVEEKMIRELADRYLVIAAGGGGIPVIRKEGLYRGVEAVIDKDLAAQLLAKAVNSEVLIILTDVSHVALNFGQPDEKQLGRVTIDELQHYEQEGHFASGSMGPKVRAAINFVREGGERAIITSLDCVVEAVNGDTGTQVFYNRLSAYGTDYRLIS